MAKAPDDPGTLDLEDAIAAASGTLGYARVSTDQQDLALQLDALRRAGVRRIFRDEGVSGAVFRRPGLDALLAAAKPGDTVVVWDLSRLGRDFYETTAVVGRLDKAGVRVVGLTDNVDTATEGGVTMLAVMSAHAHNERTRIQKRVRAGMQAAKERGVHVGRPPAMTPDADAECLRRIEAGETVLAICRALRIGEATMWRAVRRARIRRAEAAGEDYVPRLGRRAAPKPTE